jgi:hypothetical protein
MRCSVLGGSDEVAIDARALSPSDIELLLSNCCSQLPFSALAAELGR